MATATILVPPIDSLYATDSARYMGVSSPALGPEWIRHTVESLYPQHRVRIVYGQIGEELDPDTVIRRSDTFFGVSCTSLSYPPSVPFIKRAQELGVPVVVGGAHARTAVRALLRRRPGVMVATGWGESVVADLLNGVDPEKVPGLRCSLDSPQSGRPQTFPYEMVPFLHQTTDYTPFFTAWQRSGQRVYHDLAAQRVVAVRGITGCTKRSVCSFCAVQRVPPYDFENRGRYLAAERLDIIERFGGDTYIRDCSDALPDQRCLETLAEHLGDAADGVRTYCGAMVWELLEERRLESARRAGYTDFLIGLEAFCEPHLPYTGKPPETMRLLFEFLDRTRGDGIHIFVSGIIGWPGETAATLAESSRTIERLLTYPQIVSVSVNYLLALPGTIVHRDLAREGCLQLDDDMPDLRAAFLRHLELRSPTMSFGGLVEFVDRVVALDPRVVQYTGFSAADWTDERRAG
jgi:radical SAM superfamily enzyme YgiQ (UPF0313 family)